MNYTKSIMIFVYLEIVYFFQKYFEQNVAWISFISIFFIVLTGNAPNDRIALTF